MKVYLLWEGMYEPYLVGVFATKELAEDRLEEIVNSIPMKHTKRIAAKREEMDISEERVHGAV
jgi:hypothetical protein